MQKCRHRMFYLLSYILIAAVLISLLIFPAEMSEAVLAALSLCVKSVIPSLFPFLAISSMIVLSGLSEKIGKLFAFPIQKIFKLPGESATAIFLGILSGFPIGASTAVDLYTQKVIEKNDAERLLAFCNNTGPAFVIGAVGVGMFGDAKIGAALYLVHIVSALLVGILFSFTVKGKYRAPLYLNVIYKRPPLKKVFVSSVKNAALNMLYIVSFVVFFGVIIKTVFIISGMSQGVPMCIISLFAEVTSGVSSISALFGISPAAMIFSSFALGWAGLSVHAQVLSVAADTDLSPVPYFIGKALHATIAAILTFLLLIL